MWIRTYDTTSQTAGFVPSQLNKAGNQGSVETWAIHLRPCFQNPTEAGRYGERTIDLISSFTNTMAMTSGRRPLRGSIISVLAILKED